MQIYQFLKCLCSSYVKKKKLFYFPIIQSLLDGREQQRQQRNEVKGWKGTWCSPVASWWHGAQHRLVVASSAFSPVLVDAAIAHSCESPSLSPGELQPWELEQDGCISQNVVWRKSLHRRGTCKLTSRRSFSIVSLCGLT